MLKDLMPLCCLQMIDVFHTDIFDREATLFMIAYCYYHHHN